MNIANANLKFDSITDKSSQIMVTKCKKCNLKTMKKLSKYFCHNYEKLLKKLKLNFKAKTIFKSDRPVV